MKKSVGEKATNNIVVTYKSKNGQVFYGRYKTREAAEKWINSDKWNSPKNMGDAVISIKEI